MKKIIIYLLVLIISVSACKKEKTPPPANTTSTTCVGSTWKYEVAFSTAVTKKQIWMIYTDDYGTQQIDSTFNGTNWSKTITIASNNPLVAAPANLTVQCAQLDSVYVTVTINIYKNGVQKSFSTGSPGPFDLCYKFSNPCPGGSLLAVARGCECQ